MQEKQEIHNDRSKRKVNALEVDLITFKDARLIQRSRNFSC